MTTAPIAELHRQASKIASTVKSAKPNGKPTLKFTVAMDDKLLIIELSWASVQDTTEAALAAYVLKQMQEARDN